MARQFSLGQDPIWATGSFADAFFDGFLENNDPNTGMSVKSLMAPLAVLSTALERVISSCRLSSFKPDDRVKLQTLLSRLHECTELTIRCPAQTKSVETLYEYIQDLTQRVRGMSDGEVMIIPGGWSRLLPKEKKRQLSNSKDKDDTSAQAPDEDQVDVKILMLVMEIISGTCRLTVVNTGEGIDYHAATYVGESAEPGRDPPQVRHSFTFSLDNIPLVRLTDSAFWFALFRGLVFPHEQNGPQLLYETLLPYLNDRPLMENMNTTDLAIEYNCRPHRGDRSMFIMCLEAFRVSLCRALSIHKSKYICLMLKLEMCKMMDHDVSVYQPDLFTDSDARLVRLACRQLSSLTSRHAEDPLAVITTEEIIEIKRFIDGMDERVRQVLERSKNPTVRVLPPELKVEKDVALAPFPLFDRFVRKEDVEKLAGKSTPPPIFRPIEFTLIPEVARTYDQVQLALRHADHLCTLLSYQNATIKNTYLHRVALIQHLFTTAIPLPLPHNHPARETECFWSQPMRYADQIDILRSINRVARHFSASALSLRITRMFDASRVLTMSCMATITDAVMRIRACDIPSHLCLHFSGQGGGPFEQEPFWFDVSRSFALQSQMMQFVDPNLVAIRTKVLDYFNAQRESFKPEYLIFNWEQSMGVGNEIKLFERLCWQVGFPTEDLPSYLTGDNNQTELLDFYPELKCYRDTVFLFKYMMAPNVEAFPEVRPWMQKEARLHWKYDLKAGMYQVMGFGDKPMKCVSKTKDEEEDEGIWARIVAFFMKQTRAPASGADPSALCGKRVRSEDDVLHIRQLPDFEGRMSQRDSELLLSYLTVPYMRIPLVLWFFACPERIHCLGVKELQHVVDCCLFEPALWQAEKEKKEPKSVPADNRDHLATPCGLLFNELVHSPVGMIKPIQALLDIALDLDTGKYSPGTSRLILYIVRVVVRVEAYMRYLIQHHQWDNSPNKINSVCAQSYTRGLQAEGGVVAELEMLSFELRGKLHQHVFPMIERWSLQAGQSNEEVTVILHAHLAMLFQNTEYQELTRETITTHLSAQIVMTARYTYLSNVAREGKQKRVNERDFGILDMSETELFGLFQKQRWKIFRWLQEHPDDANEVMEAVVRVVTLTGNRKKRYDGQPLVTRQWASMEGINCRGRYVPNAAVNDVVVEDRWGVGQLEGEDDNLDAADEAQAAGSRSKRKRNNSLEMQNEGLTEINIQLVAIQSMCFSLVWSCQSSAARTRLWCTCLYPF